jgi:hypothetical protein
MDSGQLGTMSTCRFEARLPVEVHVNRTLVSHRRGNPSGLVLDKSVMQIDPTKGLRYAGAATSRSVELGPGKFGPGKIGLVTC